MKKFMYQTIIRGNKRGFTIVELMVAMVVTLIVIAGVYTSFIQSNRNYSAEQDKSDMQQNARAGLEFIKRELQNAYSIDSVNCSANNSNVTFKFIEEAGAATSGSATTLADTTKSWSTNAWANDMAVIANGTGSGDSGTASSGASTTLTDTSKAWTSNQWQNALVKITSGTGSGQTRTISSNTATVLTVSAGWSTTPDSTSVYSIVPIRTIGSNTSTTLTVSSNWAVTPDATSLYEILETRGFSRDATNDQSLTTSCTGNPCGILLYTKGASSNQPLANNITGLTLQGYDASGTSICDTGTPNPTNPGSIKKLEITLTARTEGTDPNFSYTAHTYTFSTRIKLRN